MSEEIYLMRHGLTESNIRKIYAGWSDECLSHEGVNALLEVGRNLKEFNIEKIFSSPIRRAVQTAEIINTFLNKKVEIETNFIEMKMGPWEGLTEDEVAKEFPAEWQIWNSKPSKLKLDGRETLKELQLRTLKAIKKISNHSVSSIILAVTHVSIIRSLIIYYNKLPMDDYRKIEVPNAAVYLLDNKAKRKKFTRVL